ncbi:MAG: alpha/beta hydrolase [Candidatus Zambryskibacteria bacterium]|nr:alpha/beta hydrolase [Candidatus Zambryskibacteria bacterium]
MKRVFIIHGWGGHPEEGCFPWLKKELQTKGFQVFNPAMPNPLRPEIETWVSFLNNLIGTPDENTYLFGHSIGVQTILRYLENLPDNVKIGGAVFLAGWVNLTNEAYDDAEDAEIAKSWLETPINWAKIKYHTKKFIAIFSDNDSLVPLSDAEIFKEKLGAKIIVENNKGHFSGSDGIDNLPSALEALLELTSS